MKKPALSSLNGKKFDVVVIGAGINGCAAAQQLAAQGFSTLIIDKGDFAEGATSKSSRLLHCGLRHLTPGKSLWEFVTNPVYLATALINTKASMVARKDISETMPELTHLTKFCFPIYEEDPFSPILVDAAFSLLKILGPKDPPLEYKRYKADEMAEVPFSSYLRDPDKIKGMAVFNEFLFDWPERIAIDTLLDATRMGATARNYTTFKTLEEKSDNTWDVFLQNALNPEDQITVNARLVLNVAGAWSDQVAEDLNLDASQKVLKLKGAHIVLQLPPEFSDWGMLAMNRAKEPLYCVPNRGLHLVGLNRVPYEQDASGVVAEEDEVDWLLGEINYLMPKLNVTRADVKYTMAGLQPITFDPKEPHGSRAIKIHDLEKEGLKNVLTLTGGPIMTHRQVGKDLANAVGKRLSPSQPPQKLSSEVSETTKKLNDTRGQNRSIQYSKEILQKIAIEEQPANLADVLFRRTGIAWNKGQGREIVEEIAEILAGPLNWDEGRTKKEIQNYLTHLDNEFSNHTD